MATTFIADPTAGLEIPGDGTLSRKVHDGDVRLVAFAFDTGQELTEHTTPRPALLQVTKGRLHVTVADAEFDAAPGSWLYLEPGAPHSLTALEPSIVLLTLLSPPSS